MPAALKKTAMALLVVAAFLVLAEMLLRGVGFDFQPREKTAYKPWVAMKFGTEIEHYPTEFDPPGYIWLMPKSAVSASDFRTAEFVWPAGKTAGKKLVAFLGGSTTQPDWLRAYPRRCIKLLNEAAGHESFETINCGMSSYSTHQSLIALKRYVLPLKPDFVVVYHGWNDNMFHPDGYSDRETDFLFRSNRLLGAGAALPALIEKLRLAKALACGQQKADRSWPRPRVSFAEFEKNLSEMAELCGSIGAKLVIVSRPANALGTANEYEPRVADFFAPLFGPGRNDIYFGLHRTVTNIQARMPRAWMEYMPPPPMSSSSLTCSSAAAGTTPWRSRSPRGWRVWINAGKCGPRITAWHSRFSGYANISAPRRRHGRTWRNSSPRTILTATAGSACACTRP